MTTQFIEDVDTDLFTVLDFEYEVPCDMSTCDRVAAWTTIFSCCGANVLYCEEDFTEIVNQIGNTLFYCDIEHGGCGGMSRNPFSFTEKLKK